MIDRVIKNSRTTARPRGLASSNIIRQLSQITQNIDKKGGRPLSPWASTWAGSPASRRSLQCRLGSGRRGRGLGRFALMVRKGEGLSLKVLKLI